MKRIGKSLDSREQVETRCFVFNNSKLLVASFLWRGQVLMIQHMIPT